MRLYSRRKFFFLLGAVVAGCRSSQIAPTIYAPGSTQPVIQTPTPQPTVSDTNGLPLPEAAPLTPINRLYVKSYRTVPDGWTALQIDGLVGNPITLNIDEIRAMPAQTFIRTLECISNPVGGGLIGNVRWIGTPLAPILERIGIKADAKYVHFEAADGYTTAIELKWLLQPDVMLVYGADETELPSDHGAPLRILIPGLYGQKQPKWLTRMTFATEDKLGYWEGPVYGWSNIAEVKTNSQIRRGDEKTTVGTSIRFEGFAYAGKRAITKVEISLNGTGKNANWVSATLIQPDPVDPLVWTWWATDWLPSTPGVYSIAVRATDETGFTQSRSAKGVMGGAFPDGTDAIHETILQVV